MFREGQVRPGGAHEELYLCVQDTETEPGRLEQTGISNQLITDLFHNSRSKTSVVILDCCYSGRFKTGTLEPLFRGYLVLASSSPYRRSHDPSGSRMPSVFTKHLADALTGRAAAGRDGMVSFSAVVAYVTDAMLREIGEGPWTKADGSGPSLPLARDPFFIPDWLTNPGGVRQSVTATKGAAARADEAERIRELPDEQMQGTSVRQMREALSTWAAARWWLRPELFSDVRRVRDATCTRLDGIAVIEARIPSQRHVKGPPPNLPYFHGTIRHAMLPIDHGEARWTPVEWEGIEYESVRSNDCPACRNGQVGCDTCQRRGFFPCPPRVTCATCKAAGWDPVEHGRGHPACPTCSGRGWDECGRCNGTSRQDCPDCRGDEIC